MRRPLVAAAITTSAIFVATPAFAAWVVRSLNGSTTVSAATLPAGSGTPTAAPNPAANSATVRVTFNPLSFKGSNLGSYNGGGYRLSRFASASGGPAVSTMSCTTSPCDVASVPDGTWYFDVTPALQNWRGAATTHRAQTVVDTTPPPGLTITGVGANGNSETLRGTAGTATNDQATLTVVVCPTDTFPCPGFEASSTTVPVTGGTWSWNTGGIGNKHTHWAQVTQSDAAGNEATAVFGPFTT